MIQFTKTAIGVSLLCLFAGPAIAAEPDAPETLIGRAEAVSITVQHRLAGKFRHQSEDITRDRGALVSFYAERGVAGPVWVDGNGYNERARSVQATLQTAGDWGLRASAYSVAPIDPASTPYPAVALAEAELAMSFAVLKYARHAQGGLVDPRSLSKFHDREPQLPDAHGVMQSVAGAPQPGKALLAYHPTSPQFLALREKLLEMRGGATPPVATGKVKMPRGPMLRPGDRHEHVVLLRKRLEVPVPSNREAARIYDDRLVEAVIDFQRKHRLRADAIVGPGTKRVMNGGRVERPRRADPWRILANMERWRWMPRDLGERHVWISIPEFRFWLRQNEKTLHSEILVVGKLRNQTPIFSDEMEHLVFNPYWNVPNSIKVEEILPYLRRDTFSSWWGGRPSVLARHNMRVKYRGREIDPSRVNWSRVDVRRYHFYQPPGGPNVLGVVKFMFPNKHAVYMHDTTTKSLFSRPVRAYSHGCMRVRNPLAFARALLSDQGQNWSMGRIQSMVNSGRNQQIDLPRKVPVHVTYFTARVDERGRLKLISDIYGHDGRLIPALKAKLRS